MVEHLYSGTNCCSIDYQDFCGFAQPAKNESGDTLHITSHFGKMFCLQVLVENNAEVNAKNNLMQTPLMILTKSSIACEEVKIRGLELLIEAGADLTLKDAKNKNFLDYPSVFNTLSMHYTSTLSVFLTESKNDLIWKKISLYFFNKNAFLTHFFMWPENWNIEADF